MLVQDISKLYSDYYGKKICKSKDLPLNKLIDKRFKPAVASVDFYKKTKDLPYAHFDAETFNKSNHLLIQFQL